MGDEGRTQSVGTQQYILQAVLESPRDIVIFALDERYRYLAFNEAHRRTILDIWNVHIAIGQCMLDVIGRDDDRAKAKANFDRALAGEHFIVVEEYGQEGSSRRYYEDVYSPIRATDGAVIGVTLFLTDITEQKRAERLRDELAESERRNLEERLRHTQKLESLGVLAGGITHDFNNLLVGVLGNADMALRSAEATPDLRRRLERIKTAAVRASELTGQLLAYSGKAPFLVRSLDLGAVVREMSDLMGVSAPKSATLVLDLADQPLGFEGNSAQIRQVVMNLIANAADAVSDAGGTITLRTSVDTLDREALAATYVDNALDAGPYVCLEVSDTGPGMAADTRERLFDPFFSTKAKGRGLGLAAVLGIVRSHCGAIAVVSAPGKGSTFRVYLPKSDQSVAVEAPMPIEGWHASGTVLIADDEPRVRQVLAMMLTDIGFQVLEAATATACVSLYREHAGAINAIMVDLMMPGGGGREVVRVLRAEGHRVPIVVSSGYSEEAIGADLRADPQLAFLEKPFEYATFVRTLQSAIGTARKSRPSPIPS